MKYFGVLTTVFVVGCTVSGFGDDQAKAEKMLHKISAMATDATGRRVVSMTVADTLGAKRSDLVNERRTLGLNYGDIFLAHTLVKNGAKMEDIATQVKAKKSMADIANEQHVDWKQIAGDAKKLNGKMEDKLFNHFQNGKADVDRDLADKYDVVYDGVTADNDVSKDELADAETTYQTLHDRAEKTGGAGTLDTVTEKAARGMRGDAVRQDPGSHADGTKGPPQ